MKFTIRKVLFLGVGGISMHQLALAFKSLGLVVYGYDAKESKYTKICEQNGIKIIHKFNKDFCKVDLCVKTGAIKNGKFLQQLKSQNTVVVDRAVALNWVCSKFKKVIAVAGTHGKTTTASLIYNILKVGGKRVSSHIGADLNNAQLNFSDEYLVVEACEYNKSFLSLFADVTVVTNIEAEHMDCYKSMFELKNAFLKFLKRGKQRFVSLNKTTKFLKKYKCVQFVDNCNVKIIPKLKGEYNLANIALAVSVCQSLGVDDESIISVVNNFSGVSRRYELIGEIDKTKIFIDYAHHPTEVKSFITTFCEEYKNCLIIFQPHTYSRTKQFFKEFISVLSGVENLIIFKEYPARENKSCGKTAKELYFELKKKNINVSYMAKDKNLSEKIKNFEAVAFVGAGDINVVAEKLLKNN